MVLFFSTFIALGSFLAMLFVLRYYLEVKKKCAGFPFVHFLPSLIFDYVTGKIPKDVSINSVIFQRLVQLAKQHAKEGLYMFFHTRPVLVIFGEESIKIFANEKAVVDKSSEYRIIETAFGAGIITSSGNRWKTHRKIINPAFNLSILKENVYLFNEHAMALIKDMEKLVDEPYVNLSRHLKKHYFNALSESIFGVKNPEENKSRTQRMAKCVDLSSKLLIKRMACPWLYPKFLLPLFSTGRIFNQTVTEMDDIVYSLISEIKDEVFSPKPENNEYSSNNMRKSFAYLLLNQHLNDPSFTLKDVHDEAKTILIAGYDSVTWSTMWCLYLLGLHPDIQERAFEEVMSSTSDFITYEESSNLKYLNAIIMESLRIYPTVPLFSRNLTKEVKFGKYKVSKDTTILFFPYILHRDSKMYPNPETFDPERFLNYDLKKSCSFMPFAEGNRSCIGKNFALFEMKIFLSHILRNFKIISLDKREDLRLSWVISLTPVKPLRMRIVQRNISFS